MDVKKLDTAPASNAGVVMEVRHPETGEPLEDDKGPVTITLMGVDSDKFTLVKNSAINRRIKGTGRIIPTAEEEFSAVTEMMVACTVAWSNIDWDGNPLEFSKVNVRKLYGSPGHAWLRRQVDAFMSDRGNFLTPPSAP